MSRPILVVGDVQGDAERLDEALRPYPDDEVDTVFLGDFFQGGRPGAGGGAAAARIARARRNSRAVLGNHDLFLLCVLEEQRSGTTPEAVRARWSGRLADVWLWRRGDWADLREVDGDGGLEQWVRDQPLMLRLVDGTLVQHADDDSYVTLGADVDSVNRFARQRLTEPGGAWEIFGHTVGRRAFEDASRLERHLAHFGAARVVHGHTPHHGDRPAVSHGGRVWSFDGCFSRYWSRGDGGAGPGPITATVALLPGLDEVPIGAR